MGSQPNLKKISDKKVELPTFVIDDSQIKIVEKAKYLGVQLDQHLVWDELVSYVRTKVSRALGILKYAKKLLLQETLSHTIEVSLSHIFVTVAQCGGAVGKPGFLRCRSYKILLPKR